MADLKISQLSDGGASQATDEYVVARSGSNFRIDGASVAAAATSVGTLSSLTVSGDLTVDTSTLKVDSTNNRVGIGTASPSTTFHIKGNQELVRLESTSATGQNFLQWYDSSDRKGYFGYAASANNNLYITNEESGASILFGTAAVTNMTLDASGNLGLGVTPSAWADYKALQTTGAAFMGYSDGASNNQAIIAANAFFTTGSTWKYIYTDNASYYRQFDGQHQWFNAPSGTAGNAITFTQAMTLDASGNLGVGTAPSDKLDVLGGYMLGAGNRTDNTTKSFGWRVSNYANASNPMNVIGGLSTSSDNLVYIGGSDSNLVGTAATNIRFYTASNISTANGTERARITSGGYFKASDAGTYLDSAGIYHELRTSNSDNASVIVSATNASYIGPGLQVDITRNTTNNTFYAYSYYNRTAGAYRFIVADSGNVTNTNNSYGAISDEKVKQDIVDAASQWDDIKGVRVRKFHYKNDPDGPLQIGVVAQELEAVSPGLVDAAPDYEEVEVTDEDGNVTTERQATGTVTKSVKYSVLYMKSIKALQEAMARIEALEARLEALEA